MESGDIRYKTTPLQDHLTCPICQSIYNNPKTTRCGHTFCYSCITESLNFNQLCPLDRNHIDELREIPLVLKNLIDELEVYCGFEKNGCGWDGKRWDLENHMGQCGFRVVECGCGAFIEKRILSDYEETNNDGDDAKCPHEKYNCEYCNEIINGLTKSMHLSKCESNYMKCEGCQLQIVTKDYNNHITDCSEYLSPCSAFECDYRGNKIELQDHKKQCVFIKLSPIFQNFQSKIDELEDEKLQNHKREIKMKSIIQQEREFSELSKQIKEMNNELQKKSFQIEEINSQLNNIKFEINGNLNIVMFLKNENIKLNNELLIHKNLISKLNGDIQSLVIKRFSDEDGKINLKL